MTEAEVRDLALRSGLSPSYLREHPSVGVDNHIWFLGDDLLLRTPRDATAAQYMQGELEIWEFVQSAGIAIPELIATGLRDDGLPFMIVRRIHGRLLGEYPADVELTAFIQDFVEQLALLHSLPVHGQPWHRPFDHFDPWRDLRKAAERQLLPPDDLVEIEALIRRLGQYPGNFTGDVGEARRTAGDVLTHNDLHPWNLMVTGEVPRLASLLDWGDNCVSDRRNDFCTMPLAIQILIAEAYRERMPDVGDAFEARCLWGWLDMSLWEIRDLADRGFPRHWWRWPMGGWGEAVEILRRAPRSWQL